MEKAARTIENILNPVCKTANYFGQVVLVAMMLLIALDVVLRYFLNSPLKGSYELVELGLVLIVFFALAYTQMRKGHIGVDTVTIHLKPGVLALVNSATYLLSLGAFSLITWRSLVEAVALRESGTISPLLAVPVFPIMGVVALGSGLLSLTFLVDFVHSVARVLTDIRRPWLWLLLPAVTVLLLAAFPTWLHWLPWQMSQLTVGLIGTTLLVVVLFSGMYVGSVMLVTGFICFAYLTSWHAGFTILGLGAFGTAANYSLSTLPLFVLMGLFCFYANLSTDIYNTFNKWIGRFPGGLAIATICASAAFSAVSGSGPATALTVGTSAIPEMRKYNYSDGLACACVAAGGTLGILIPPSIPMIFYAQLTETSIGRLFMAGVIPGIILAIMFTVMIYFQVRLNPAIAPRGPVTTTREKFHSLGGTWGILLLFSVVMGGIYFGVFTATEAAGIGAVGALVIGLAKRQLKRHNISSALDDTMKNVGMAFLMLIGATIFGQFTAVSHIAEKLAEIIVALPVPNYVIMIAIIIFYIIAGGPLPEAPLIILTVPIFFPLVVAMGYDPIWYGIIMVVMMEIGAITPPLAINLFVVGGVAKDVPISVINRGIVPFLLVYVVFLALIIIFPDIVLFLPNMMMGG